MPETVAVCGVEMWLDTQWSHVSCHMEAIYKKVVVCGFTFDLTKML